MKVKKKPRKSAKARFAGLLLEDGTFWPGQGFGAETTQVGECVFHTGHTGYQEILTDPSYHKQILIFSSVQFGNQGFHADDFESAKVWAAGAVVRDYSEPLYHWRKETSVNQVLESDNVPGISGIDTRRLILHLREKGNLWGMLSTEGSSHKEIESKLRKKMSSSFSMSGLSLTQDVTTRSCYSWAEGSKNLLKKTATSKVGLKRVVVMDFGVKRQILRYLIDSGFQEAIVVPAHTKAKEIEALSPDAVFLSNGPGDPAADMSIVEEVKILLKKYPVLGICLGHQILALALGLKTFKLKFGHHGANHPVKNLRTDKIEITSQNHGFAVGALKKPSEIPHIEFTHFNLNDNTVEGFIHKTLPICAIQFHPESSPGPLDSLDVFKQFQRGVFS